MPLRMVSRIDWLALAGSNVEFEPTEPPARNRGQQANGKER
jgi:hypothetical protein